MKDLSLVDALRFAFAGILLYVYIYILFPHKATHFASAAGPIGFPVILTAVGSSIYFIYRPLYDQGIERLQDQVTRRPMNYRQELRNRYNIDFEDAVHLFIQVREHFSERDRISLVPTSAGVHLMYQAGILAIPMAGIAAWYGQIGHSWRILAFGVVAFVAGWVNDARQERIERNKMILLGWLKVDETARRLGHPLPPKVASK